MKRQQKRNRIKTMQKYLSDVRKELGDDSFNEISHEDRIRHTLTKLNANDDLITQAIFYSVYVKIHDPKGQYFTLVPGFNENGQLRCLNCNSYPTDVIPIVPDMDNKEERTFTVFLCYNHALYLSQNPAYMNSLYELAKEERQKERMNM